MKISVPWTRNIFLKCKFIVSSVNTEFHVNDHKVYINLIFSLIKLSVSFSVLTLIPSLTWAIAKGVAQGDNCWMVDTNGYQWINDGFRIGVLAVNTFLLLDIIRVMLLKMKHGNTSRQTKYIYLNQIGNTLTTRQKKIMLWAY